MRNEKWYEKGLGRGWKVRFKHLVDQWIVGLDSSMTSIDQFTSRLTDQSNTDCLQKPIKPSTVACKSIQYDLQYDHAASFVTL